MISFQMAIDDFVRQAGTAAKDGHTIATAEAEHGEDGMVHVYGLIGDGSVIAAVCYPLGTGAFDANVADCFLLGGVIAAGITAGLAGS